MVYMSVLHDSDTRLKLLREPSLLSKAVFIGFLIGVIGVFLFGSESCFFKVLIGLVTVGLSFFMVDNYEICEFDKEQGEVRLSRLHWFQYLLDVGMQPYIVVKLEDIKDVKIEEQGGDAGKRSFQVALSLYSGVQLGITEIFTTDPIEQHKALSKKIMSFVSSTAPTYGVDDVDKESRDEDKSSEDDDEDDFEQISKADLEDMEEGPASKETEPAE
ncbi:uncharacterized protein LOC101857869 [Aplysia californica]|uniref:Essential for reactive oxygen species protein n=1 Tax=Aplysia californica TaxID=6500 RepID=A0ABM0JKI2_APLCA|nr:uncharacterized protein LOC101857869 [Aplysia californica]XP_005095850.1 uncharacterized protein LOC101857869 [Aplysia californica]